MKTKLFFLFFIFVTCIESATAEVYSGICGINLTWSLNTEDSTLIIAGTGTMTDYSVPSVSRVPWYTYRTAIKTLSLPNGLTNVGKYAFYNCTKLTIVDIPNSVTSIGENAFNNCSGLTSIELPNNITSIGEKAFYRCGEIGNLVVPENIKSIYKSFQGCTIDTLFYNAIRHDDVINSSDGPFYSEDCTVHTIIIGENVEFIPAGIFGRMDINHIELPNSVKEIGQKAFYGCSQLQSITIGDDVTTIGTDAFSQCIKLQSIYIPCGTLENYQNIFPQHASLLKYLPQYKVFTEPVANTICQQVIEGYNICNAESDEVVYSISAIPNEGYHFVQWSDGVTDNPRSIEVTQDTTFTAEFSVNKYTLTALSADTTKGRVSNVSGEYEHGTKVIISAIAQEGMYVVGWSNGETYHNCEDSVSYQYTITEPTELIAYFGPQEPITGTCGDSLYWAYDCSETLTIYGKGAMNNYSKTTSNRAPWYDYSIKSIIISDEVTNVGSYAFNNCTTLKSVSIGAGVRVIEEGAFAHCENLTSIVIPDSVTSLGVDAFRYCYALENVVIGENVEIMGNSVFNKCAKIKTVHWNAKNYRQPKPNSSDLNSFPFNSARDSIISFVFGDGVRYIPAFITKDFTAIDTIIIPMAVEEIGEYAFANQLRKLIVLSDTPAIIGANAFGTYNIIVPCGSKDTYKSAWSDYAMQISYGMSSFNINVISSTNGLVSILSDACDNLGQLEVIPNEYYHFIQWSDGNTDNPRIVVLTQDTTFTAEFAIDITGACGDANQLTWTFDSISGTLAISGNGTLNSNYTFGGQSPSQTKRLIIEEGVTSIGNYAFYGMGATITSLALPNSLTTIGDSAFAGLNNRKFNTLVLPNTIISIGAHAFDGATYLKTIHFGSALEEIGDYAFNGCARVQEMTCLAEITPNVGTDGLTSINSLAKLYVPNEFLFEYQIDPNWSRFVLTPIGATATNIITDDVTVTTDDNTATLTWPTNNAANTYTIEITKDREVFCTLIFNANGQLTGIAFAPSRNRQPHAPAATMTANGMQFTVTGLNSGTNYSYTVTSKSGTTVLASYTGEFETTGTLSITTDIDNPSANLDGYKKLLRNGQILIVRGDKTYTLTGQEIK